MIVITIKYILQNKIVVYEKNRSIRTTFYTANQLIIVLLLIYASSHNAFSQPIENSISSYPYNNGDTIAPDINSPIMYRVVDNEKKEVGVIRGVDCQDKMDPE